MDGVGTYIPTMVKIALGNHIVTGYAEDSFVTIEPIGDGVTAKAGCDGEIVRSVDPNTRFSVKLSLLASSATHRFLTQKLEQDRKNGTGIFPILVKDLMGKEKFSADRAWVTKLPSNVKGKEAQNKEWTIETGQADFQYE